MLKREIFGEIVLKDGDIANDILDYIKGKGFRILMVHHIHDNKTHYEIIKETESKSNGNKITAAENDDSEITPEEAEKLNRNGNLFMYKRASVNAMIPHNVKKSIEFLDEYDCYSAYEDNWGIVREYFMQLADHIEEIEKRNKMPNKQAVKILKDYIDYLQTVTRQAKKAGDESFNFEQVILDIRAFEKAIDVLSKGGQNADS